jgi:hypothetical protein
MRHLQASNDTANPPPYRPVLGGRKTTAQPKLSAASGGSASMPLLIVLEIASYDMCRLKRIEPETSGAIHPRQVRAFFSGRSSSVNSKMFQ